LQPTFIRKISVEQLARKSRISDIRSEESPRKGQFDKGERKKQSSIPTTRSSCSLAGTPSSQPRRRPLSSLNSARAVLVATLDVCVAAAPAQPRPPRGGAGARVGLVTALDLRGQGYRFPIAGRPRPPKRSWSSRSSSFASAAAHAGRVLQAVGVAGLNRNSDGTSVQIQLARILHSANDGQQVQRQRQQRTSAAATKSNSSSS
jgi:hypothetical protein